MPQFASVTCGSNRPRCEEMRLTLVTTWRGSCRPSVRKMHLNLVTNAKNTNQKPRLYTANLWEIAQNGCQMRVNQFAHASLQNEKVAANQRTTPYNTIHHKQHANQIHGIVCGATKALQHRSSSANAIATIGARARKAREASVTHKRRSTGVHHHHKNTHGNKTATQRHESAYRWRIRVSLVAAPNVNKPEVGLLNRMKYSSCVCSFRNNDGSKLNSLFTPINLNSILSGETLIG